MREPLRTTWLAAEFFTHHHRITGRVDVRQQKLADQLNNRTTSFLRLEDAYVSNIERPTEIIASYEDAYIRKDRLIAVLVAQQEDALPREGSYGAYLGTSLLKAFMTVPTFEVRGYVRLSTKMDLRVVLTTGTDDFIAVLDGELHSATQQGLGFKSDAILVNKQHIEIFWVEQEGQQNHGQNPGN